MSLYQCDECGVVENTAVGFYHTRNWEKLWPKEYVGRMLCSECGPPVHADGTDSGLGKWHGKFEKTFYEKGTMETCPNTGNLRRKK